MINSTKLMITLLAVLTSFQAHGMDVYGKYGKDRSPDLIRVELYEDGTRVSFEYCRKYIDELKCDFIGPSRDYSIQELEDQRFIEFAQAAGVSLGWAGLTVTGAGAGYTLGTFGGLAITSTSGGSSAALTIGSAVVGGALPSVLLNLFDALDVVNPMEQYNQARAIRNAVIYDQDLIIDSESVMPLVERLELVLNKI